MVADPVKRGLSMWKIGSSNPSQVKPKIYQIDICAYIAWCWAFSGQDYDWLGEFQDSGISDHGVGDLVS